MGNLLESYAYLGTRNASTAVNRLQSALGEDSERAKILVVDDEIEVVTALKIRLQFAGYEVISAFDGVSATRAVLITQPDLVILDIGMPMGDGHEVARRLTDHLDALLVPVIFLTARTSQADRALAKKVGAADYITKPYDSKKLLEAVNKAFSWKPPRKRI